VELRIWLVNTFRVAIPLMALLDEAFTVRDLGRMVTQGMPVQGACIATRYY